jgi:hypothetical protein
MCDSASPAAWNATSISAQDCARCQDPIKSVVGASVGDALVGSVVVTSDAELESSLHPAAIVRLTRTMPITMRLLTAPPSGRCTYCPFWCSRARASGTVPAWGLRIHSSHSAGGRSPLPAQRQSARSSRKPTVPLLHADDSTPVSRGMAAAGVRATRKMPR